MDELVVCEETKLSESKSLATAVAELNQLQLSLIGGGIGETVDY